MEGTEEVLTVEVEEEGAVGVLPNKTHTEMGAIRDEKGRLLPGVRLPGAGRKSRQYEKDMINAVKDVLTPENIKHYLTTALDLAVSQQSARGIVAVLTLGMAYGAGKPVQQVTVDNGKTELLEQLLRNDGEPLLPDPASMNEIHTC